MATFDAVTVDCRHAAPLARFWTEALDKGDPKNKVPHRDKVLTLAAPFSAAPSEIAKTEYRYSNYEQGFDRHQVVAGFGFRF